MPFRLGLGDHQLGVIFDAVVFALGGGRRFECEAVRVGRRMPREGLARARVFDSPLQRAVRHHVLGCEDGTARVHDERALEYLRVLVLGVLDYEVRVENADLACQSRVGVLRREQLLRFKLKGRVIDGRRTSRLGMLSAREIQIESRRDARLLRRFAETQRGTAEAAVGATFSERLRPLLGEGYSRSHRTSVARELFKI